MKFFGIIPARFASSRFPGKPLVNINGKSMIQRVYEQSLKAGCLSKVIVATDDENIRKHVIAFGGEAVMTSAKHQSGTDRCYEAAQTFISMDGDDVIINIQGDEPFIQPGQIDKIASCFHSKETGIATLIKEITDEEELLNPNKPKVIINSYKEAIYFSRSPLPYLRAYQQNEWLRNHIYYKHIGIYAYRMNVLEKISKLAPSSLELAESLEQLRWIENGFKIKIEVTDIESFSIDTPEDLIKLEEK